MIPTKKLLLDLLEDMSVEVDEKANGLRLFSEKDTAIPQWMKNAVKKGMKIREEATPSNKCCTDVGLARANQILSDDNLSLSTLKRMKSFSARHGSTVDWRSLGKDSKKAQALLLWGVPASKSGLEKFNKWVNREIAKKEQA